MGKKTFEDPGKGDDDGARRRGITSRDKKYYSLELDLYSFGRRYEDEVGVLFFVFIGRVIYFGRCQPKKVCETRCNGTSA